MFYTHSYAFGFGEPFTMTGVTGSYTFADPVSGQSTMITAGFTRGWNQSTYDNNGDLDGVFQLKNRSGPFDWAVSMTIGPEGHTRIRPSR